MDYFKLSKYQSELDNPIYLSKILFENLNRPMSIDQLFDGVGKKLEIIWSSSIEQSMMLALCFSFSIGIIKFQNGLLRRGD